MFAAAGANDEEGTGEGGRGGHRENSGATGGEEHVAPVGLREGELIVELREVAAGEMKDGEVDAFAIVGDERQVGVGEGGAGGRGLGGRENFRRPLAHERCDSDFHGRGAEPLYSTWSFLR